MTIPWQRRRVIPEMGYALAPKQLVEQRLKVRFMYREQPDGPQDSGWRFFSGDETDEYANQPDNIGLYDVNTIASIDPDIIPLLNVPAGCAFERGDSSGPFLASQGADMEEF